MIPATAHPRRSLYPLTLLLAVCLADQAWAQRPVAIPIRDQGSWDVQKATTIPSSFKELPVVEPHVSAHPEDPDHLLVAAMVVTDVDNAYESSRLSSFVSRDGGATWKETVHDWWGYDPWTAILEDGRTVMSWIGTPGAFRHRFPIRFFSSDDGGVSWSDRVQTLPGGYDGTKITSFEDVFYFTAVHFPDHSGADVVLYQREGDGLFEEVARVKGQGRRLSFCEPAVTSDGTVFVPSAHSTIGLRVHAFDPATEALSSPDTVSRNAGGGRGYMCFRSDSSMDSPHRDRLYSVRAARLSEAGFGLIVNVSSDKGVTWSSDARLDLFEDGRTGNPYVPSLAVNDDGIVGISWVDIQREGQSLESDVFFSISADGAQSFSAPIRVTRASSNPRTKANADVVNKFPGGGHYLGLAARADGSFQLVWSDSRSGMFELQTCQVQPQ